MAYGANTKNRTTHAIRILALAAFFCFGNADAGPTRTVVSKICSQTPTLDQNQLKTTRGTECAAARDNLNAKNTNTATGMIWSAVTAVCTVSCANGMSTTYCTYSQKAATAGEAALTKNFENALTPVAETATGKLGAAKSAGAQGAAAAAATGSANSGVAAASGATGRGDACTTAAKSSAEAFKKIGNAGKSKNEIAGLYQESKKLDGTENGKKGNAPTLGGETGTEKSALNSKLSGLLSGNIPGENKVCREENLRTAIGALTCAARSDPNLPAAFKTGQFLKDLEKITGKPADEFFKDFKDPASAIAAATGDALSTEQSEKLGSILSQMDHFSGASAANDESGMSVASSKISGGEVEPELDVNGLIQKMLGQNDEGEPGAENGEPSGGLDNVSSAKRNLASITAENTTVSIFDRVQWRYLVLDQKQGLGGFIERK